MPRITNDHGYMKVLATYPESEASQEMEAGARDNLPSVVMDFSDVEHSFVLIKRKMVLLVRAKAGLEESVIGESRSKVRLSAL